MAFIRGWIFPSRDEIVEVFHERFLSLARRSKLSGVIIPRNPLIEIMGCDQKPEQLLSPRSRNYFGFLASGGTDHVTANRGSILLLDLLLYITVNSLIGIKCLKTHTKKNNL